MHHQIRTSLFCTFASPRVGDSAFVEAFDALGLTSWRIVNAPDWVPNLPPEVLGYRHVSEPYIVNSTGKVRSTLACAHALQTYLVMLNPSLKPDPNDDCWPSSADQELASSASQC
jgi:Lipase (class 3)